MKNKVLIPVLVMLNFWFAPDGARAASLHSGARVTGIIYTNTVDTYTFSATNGDSIVVRMGATNFNPRIRLYGPDGTLLGDVGFNSGTIARDAELSARATNSGTFTVIASCTYTFNAAYPYVLNFAKTGEAITVSPGDEGGALTNGWKYTGTNELGDLDVWSFNANVGDSIVLRMGSVGFNAGIRLFGPDGTLLGDAGFNSGTIARDAELSARATNSGTFTVVTRSSSGGDGGSYILTLAKTGALIVTAPGDEGGALTNGWKYTGTNELGDLDVWSFNATNGDSIGLRMESTDFNTWIQLYGPDGQLIGNTSNGNDSYLYLRTTNSGTFMVVSSSSDYGNYGGYFLSFFKTGSPIFVAPGNAGGVLTNGWKHSGTIEAGDLDVWSFNATNGDSIVLRMGSTNFNPQVQLYGPDGQSLGNVYGAQDAGLHLRATNSGAFTVVSSSYSAGGNGSYILTLAKSGDPVFVSPGDEGGTLTNGWKYTGTNDVGDLDVWSFNASAGDSILLRMGSTNFNPQVQLYGPDGQSLGNFNVYGYTDVSLYLRATNSGLFTVVSSSYSSGGNGSYILTLAKTGAPVVTVPGDEGGALTNGWKHSGTIEAGDLDVWSFNASAGDSIVLRMGTTNFNPQIQFYGPDGQSLANVNGTHDAALYLRATNSGVFTVVSSSYSAGGNGGYNLTLAKSGSPIFVSPGDEGGALINGGNFDGVNDLGDEDAWAFTAKTKDSIVLRCGKTAGDGSYYPQLLLFGPDGTLLSSTGGNSDAYISLSATNSGTFVVLVGSYSAGNAGAYRLHLMQIPEPYIVPSDDEGGTISPNVNYTGTNDLGDEDIYSFTAFKGAAISVNCQKLSGTSSYNPFIRLFGPDGAFLQSAYSSSTATISYTPTNTGTFTLLVGSYYLNNSGAYQLGGSGFSTGLKTGVATVSGTNFLFTLTGGASNAVFILLTATNLSAPTWTPVLTNQFNQSGGFSFTNAVNPNLPGQFYRFFAP